MSGRVGIVVVSHSRELAEAAVGLATQVDDDTAPIAVAAGTDDGGFGTDATAVLDAIESVADPAGVLVLMDLGSAVLSAEMALEFLGDVDYEVRLTAAPLVEGLVAAVIQSGLGSDLATVASEAASALVAKREQVGDDGEPDGAGDDDGPAVDIGDRPEPDAAEDVTLVNVNGLHARPAAMVVRLAGQHDADVVVTNLTTGAGPASAASLTAIARLGARAGHRLRLEARGPQADAAVEALRDRVEDAFGEQRDPDAGDGAGADEAPATTTAVSRDLQGPPDRSPETSPDDEVEPPAWAGSASVPIQGVSPGRAIGPVVLLQTTPLAAPTDPIPDEERDAAVATLAAAVERVADDLDRRADAASGNVRDVLTATAMMARDPDVLEAAVVLVRHGHHPAAAITEVVADLEEDFRDHGGYLAERVRDLQDVRDRVVAEVLDQPLPGVPDRADPFVLVADDLAPADAAGLDRTGCVALVTREGGPTSHTAILARAHGLPAVVVGPRVGDLRAGDVVLVDGTRARLVVDPDANERARVERRRDPIPTFDGTGATADGHHVALLANVGGQDDVDAAVAADAEGIGLLRTEFLFLGRSSAPTRAEQVEAYVRLFEPFADRTVVVRTLDAGSDKPLPFVTDSSEPNPALGLRGWRTARTRPDLVDTQLAAIAEAAERSGAAVRVMAPMVSTRAEAALVARACAAHDLVPGIMIETPAAALDAGGLLDEVEFASIGTNDLGQYTLAADRLLGSVAALNNPWQPTVLGLVRASARAGDDRHKPVGVCGEAAGDPALAVVLVGLGVTSLSMAPALVAQVAAVLARTDLHQCRDLADRVLGAGSADAARDLAHASLGVLDDYGL